MTRFLSLTLLSSLLLPVGCGKQTTTLDSGDTGADDTGSGDSDTSADSDTADTDTGDTEIVGYPLDVVADGQTATVGLGGLGTVTFEGDAVVTAVSVLQASGLDVDWTARTYDFLAADGYRPSGNSCPPVDWTTMQGGYFYPDSGNLVWESSLGLFGCYYVDDTVEITVQDAR